MILTSRYPGRCNACGRAYAPGDRIDWARAIRGASHAACTDAGRAVIAAVAESTATDVPQEVAMALPCPDGLSYLGYQRAGIAYAIGRQGTIIADEMGLGKTIQAIGVINATSEVKTVLVVCPASLKHNWAREVRKWSSRPTNVHIVNGKRPPSEDKEVQVDIINYDILHKLDEKVGFDLLVCDEAHYVKNGKAKRTKALHALARRCKRVVLLTGTPILNKPVELWSLLQVAAPTVWDPPGVVKGKAVGAGDGAGFFGFAKRYCGARQEQVSRDRLVWLFDGATNLAELQERLRATCMVRRLKSDVLAELPPKRRQVI